MDWMTMMSLHDDDDDGDDVDDVEMTLELGKPERLTTEVMDPIVE